MTALLRTRTSSGAAVGSAAALAGAARTPRTGLAATLLLAGAALTTSCGVHPPVGDQVEPVIDYSRQLPPGADALLPLGPDEPAPDLRQTWLDREDVRAALDQSLTWTRRKHAPNTFPTAGITHPRALASLERFRELLVTSPDADTFVSAVAAEFQVYKSAGWDGKGGGVLFTGYCTPILRGSLSASTEYSHPLYALPEDLVKAPDGRILGRRVGATLEPYPTRQAIEANALLANQGLELVWLADPIDAYIAHVNGSAFVELPDRSMLKLGYAGKNGREYTSLGKELIEAGEVPKDRMNLASIRAWARSKPEQVEDYLNRNDSYVFFTPIDGNPHGSLDVPVTGMRSVATDKTLFPRAAITFVDAALPTPGGQVRPFHQLMFDQDTGGAIRTAGRADLYLGVGPEAERISGATQAEGQLYYYFLKG